MIKGYVDNDIFDSDEAIAAAIDMRKFLLKRLLEDRGRLPTSFFFIYTSPTFEHKINV